MRQFPFVKSPVRGGARPRQILVGLRWQVVENIVDRWRETGRWWVGESSRTFFLVETRRGLFIVSRGQRGWQVEKVVD